MSTIPIVAPGQRRAEPTSLPGGPRRRRPNLFPHALLMPALIVLLVLVGWPVVKLVITSFQHYGREQAFGKPATWTGFGNFETS